MFMNFSWSIIPQRFKVDIFWSIYFRQALMPLSTKIIGIMFSFRIFFPCRAIFTRKNKIIRVFWKVQRFKAWFNSDRPVVFEILKFSRLWFSFWWLLCLFHLLFLTVHSLDCLTWCLFLTVYSVDCLCD